jgi:hypothetical protein
MPETVKRWICIAFLFYRECEIMLIGMDYNRRLMRGYEGYIRKATDFVSRHGPCNA